MRKTWENQHKCRSVATPRRPCMLSDRPLPPGTGQQPPLKKVCKIQALNYIISNPYCYIALLRLQRMHRKASHLAVTLGRRILRSFCTQPKTPGASSAPKALQRFGALGRCFSSWSTSFRAFCSESELVGLVVVEHAQHIIPSSLRAAAMT